MPLRRAGRARFPCTVSYNIISAVLRGMGDSRSPMAFVAVACTLNILLDYIFIGGLGMAASGAALGTVISPRGALVMFVGEELNSNPVDLTRNARPYALIAGGLTLVLYLIIGFIVV